MNLAIASIIDRSFELFKKYRPQEFLDACTVCCMTPQQAANIKAMGVREIPFQLMYDYNTAAKPEELNLDEFKYFLPRLMELTANFQFSYHSEELVFSRMEYFNKEDFNSEEIGIIQEFGEAFFEACLVHFPIKDVIGIESIIVMLYKGKVDMAPIFQSWQQNTSENSTRHLNHLIQDAWSSHNPNKLMSGFADENITQQIKDFLGNTSSLHGFLPAIEELIMKGELEDWELEELNYTYEILRLKK